MIFAGIDWAEAHHDVLVLDEQGQTLAKGRVENSLPGVGKLHALLAEHAAEPGQVLVGIETDRGLLVQSMVAAGYQVYAPNPMAVARYRDRHATSGAKSDPGDAKVLADLVRTDRHLHRQVAGDSEQLGAIGVLARAHQNLIWTRQRHLNQLRSALRDYYPGVLEAFGTDLASSDALAVLKLAPTPAQGRNLSQAEIVRALGEAGRKRNLERKGGEIQAALRKPQLEAPHLLAKAYGHSTIALGAVIAQLNQQVNELERELTANFEMHPDAEILCSLPGLGVVLGARVLAEFGDDRTRFSNPKARKNYAGTSPITRASGNRKVVLARFARNDRLADAAQRWAFCSLTACGPAHAYYLRLRAQGKTNNQALRALANRWVGILHGCLDHHQLYCEEIAWPQAQACAA